MCYHQTLSEETQENLTKAMISKKAKLSGRSSWWPLPFGRSRGSTADLVSGGLCQHLNCISTVVFGIVEPVEVINATLM